MNNKILVKIMEPEFGNYYEVFIPTNEYVYVVIELILKVIGSINGIDGFPNRGYSLINRLTGEIYSMNSIIRDTNIVNATELILI